MGFVMWWLGGGGGGGGGGGVLQKITAKSPTIASSLQLTYSSAKHKTVLYDKGNSAA